MKTSNYSIRKQLILLISMHAILLTTIVGGLSLLSAYHEIEEVSDAQLVHSAKVLLQITEHEIGKHDTYETQLGVERPELAHKYENKLTFRIWKDDILVTKSYLAESFENFHAPPGFSNGIIAGEEWRFFVFLDHKTNITVEVAEKTEIRRELTSKILAGLLIPLSLFIPLLLLIIWYSVAKCLRPVVALSRGVDDRCPNDFTEIETGTVPQEIHPLIKAINRLLARIQSSFDRERQFTDNAAHELRTPLAAMKTQTQVLLKKAADIPEYKDGLDNLHASIDRASHMIDQLLSFARLQGDKIEFETLDLSTVVNEILKNSSPLTVHKKIDLEAKIAPDIKINANANALTIMLRNIIDNAIKFTPDNGKIIVSLTSDATNIVLHVSDTGSGIPDAEKDKVFERFYRANKTNTQGSGLGLSMAKWVCDIHEAQITLNDNQPNGLIVTITMKNKINKQ